MRKGWALPLMLAAAVMSAGGCGGCDNKAMALEFFAKVFVPLGPAGSSAAELKERLVYKDVSFGKSTASTVVIYTDLRYVPSGSPLTALRVWQVYEMALSDPKAGGISVNPDVAAASGFSMTKKDIERALPKIPRGEALPGTVTVKP